MSYSVSQLVDLEAIRDVARRYSRGVDRLDGELMKSAYWPDATDDHGVFVGNAWEFVERCMSSHLRWRSTMHCIFNHTVDLDPDGVRARGELYNVSYLFARDAPTADTWFGRYLDDYERRDGEWRILQRVCVHEATRSDEVSAMSIPFETFRQGSFDRPSAGRPFGP